MDWISTHWAEFPTNGWTQLQSGAGLVDGDQVSDELALALSRALRAERSRLGLSQAALAERLGISRSTVTEMENLVRRVYADELPELCEALGLTLDELLVRAPEDQRHKLGF